MRKFLLLTAMLSSALVGCEEEDKPVDPIYEFVAFKGSPTINLNEFSNSENAYPLVIELRAFQPYPQDIDIALEITGNNAAENVDFTVTPGAAVKIRSGKLVSDTIFVKTIDNAGPSGTRSVNIAIKSTSSEKISIGLGLKEPRNAVITFNILDDECAETTDIFNGALTNTVGGAVRPVAGVLTGNMLKVTGDLIDYGPFADATITITLTPETAGSTKGNATFGEQEAGDDSDGYEYKFIQTGDGTYDVCSGVVSVAYDIYYMDGDWVYWYSVTNEFSPE